MKNLIWIIILTSPFVKAETDKISVYLKFEEVYMSNDVSLLSPWLSKNYKISQTLHIPGVGADTRHITKKHLLASMRQIGKPSSMPRSKASVTKIETKNENSFCATSSTANQRVVGERKYEEKEVRKVCFERQGETYKATTHNINVHYRAL
ncbi:hypothetical protein [Microbulbifer sp. JMSA002]|uniref:hypothetical protein n=1 Tax=Microbulbifer sp. JMSA002 TaxID=3243368 RepID=UPI0040392E69